MGSTLRLVLTWLRRQLVTMNLQTITVSRTVTASSSSSSSSSKAQVVVIRGMANGIRRTGVKAVVILVLVLVQEEEAGTKKSNGHPAAPIAVAIRCKGVKAW
eukprot:COSAG06_NODE_6745_length_2799_cov_16.371852_3_plen_102_part_00